MIKYDKIKYKQARIRTNRKKAKERKLKKHFFCLYVYLSTTCVPGKRRESDTLELELQRAVRPHGAGNYTWIFCISNKCS